MTEDIADIDEFAAEHGLGKQRISLNAKIQATGQADEINAKMIHALAQKHRPETLVEWLKQLGIATTEAAVRAYVKRMVA